MFFNLQPIRVVPISSTNNSPVAQGTLPSLTGIKRVPGVPGIPTQVQYPIQLPHTKRHHSFQRRCMFFNLHIIRGSWISSSNNSPVDQGHMTFIDHNNNKTEKSVPGDPGMVSTSTQTPHIKRAPNISYYRHQAVFVHPVQRQNHTTHFRYKTNSPLDYGLLALHIYSLQHPIPETLCLPCTVCYPFIH